MYVHLGHTVVKHWCHFNDPKRTPQWGHQRHRRVVLNSQAIFNTGQILGLLTVETSDGFNRKECVLCTNMTSYIAWTCVFLVQLPSVLSDVCDPARLFLKKQGKHPKLRYLHYIFLPDSVSMPYFCSTFQIKNVDPFKGCPVKWIVCSLRIYFWFVKMVKCSFHVVFKNSSNVCFWIKYFLVCIVYIERI